MEKVIINRMYEYVKRLIWYDHVWRKKEHRLSCQALEGR